MKREMLRVEVLICLQGMIFYGTMRIPRCLEIELVVLLADQLPAALTANLAALSEQQRQQDAGDKTANVSPKGCPAHIRAGQREHAVEKLQNEPDAQDHRRGNKSECYEKTDGDEGQNPALGIKHQVRAQHCGDRAAGPHGGDDRAWVRERVG